MRPNSFADARDHGGDRRLVGDVGGDRDRLDAARPELGGRGVRLRFVAPDHRDVGAGFRQPARHAEPDAAIAAGDDGHLAGEIEEFCCHGRFLVMPGLMPGVLVRLRPLSMAEQPGYARISACPARSGSARRAASAAP